ncbi:Asp-tRNAAsn/Glu-tRNAGln amidotransferase A subunit [Rubellimicrobium thermophilum DSM 16684]|uniref:Asp-tRNAAsn/Glu-tRNAGln amidotransferase A subunit n=1 Tax=Rubellimicrobium thermophilum DSM 16684 TaxID=1123069 RepID=S9QZ20_9RHOB|nr:amidase [Rubellimicrobium thermophilum]EPX84857.1 Asp-tRNAAsn/Glu-tRNAGln amidotransferase A subunit [Rubellimicrobium thermophilum DSM 16684]
MDAASFRRMDGLGLAALIAGGEVSPLEVAETAITVIAALNPALNAVIADRFAAARAEAARLPAPGGALRGVPFLLKDVNLFSSDLPTRFASRFFAGAAPAAPGGESLMVQRWRAGGLVTLGTTNTPEFAGDFTTEPLAYGPCRNPWDRARSTGGSSGGAAAAVASGMVPIAHGTDLGGSIRIPAACCGVFGFKPSVGLNPLGPGWEEIASGLDADHVLTRTVRDSAAALDLTAGPGAGTRLGRMPPAGGFLAALEDPLPPLRIGLALADPLGRPAAPHWAAAAEATAGWLAAMGHAVEPWSWPPEAMPGEWFDALWTIDVLHLVRARAEALGRSPREGEIEPFTRAVLDHAAGLSALDLHRARLAMTRAAWAIGRAMEGFDAVLTPALAGDPPPLGTLTFAACGQSLAEWNARGFAFAPHAAPGNLAGLPAGVVPVGVGPAGLPLAVQVTGRPGGDLRLLQLCRRIEEAAGFAPHLAAMQARL